VDNLGRRKWVNEIGAEPAVEILPMSERLQLSRDMGYTNMTFVELDITDYKSVKDLIALYKPEVVLHLAAQPSAPYSQMSGEKANFTQDNNISMTRNLLWALREHSLTRSHFIETTTTGIYGAPSLNIPEGQIAAMDSDGKTDMVPYPNMASSWYHVTKGFNATNLQLMNFQTKMPTSDLRTSIVYGTDTKETEGVPGLATRFDFDFYFGTLFNRWCAMAVIGEPITVYGSGNQIKPVIHLEDAAQSMVDLVKTGNSGEYLVFNQLTEYVRIRDLAQMITDYMRSTGKDIQIKNIPNPRVEKEDTEYRFENERFMALLSVKPRQMRDSIGEVLLSLMPHSERIHQYRDRLMR
jgi:nucleoside-diphosphate-sugar epimerase